MNKNVENNLYNKYNTTQISILDSHCPGPKLKQVLVRVIGILKELIRELLLTSLFEEDPPCLG